MASHQTYPGTDIYGPGTFIDKQVLPVPADTRRVFEYLASSTPGFTQDRTAWDTVSFTGGPDPIIPGPIKAPVVAAALHAMCGLVANELLEIRDGKPLRNSSVTVDTDHAGISLGSTFATYVNGKDVPVLAKTGQLASLFDRDFEQGFGKGLAGRATAIYQTRDPNVAYQLHGSLDASKMLESMGIPTDVKFDSMQEYYDYIQSYVRQWSADELEMHNVRHGLCGSICYSPEAWCKTSMGQRLSSHPLVESDRRPLVGIKVLEMVRIIAGPTIGVTLTSYGADVIRVNCSKLADLNVLQLTLNAGKRTVDLDINKAEDMARLRELLSDVDIFIQGFRYESLERRGLGLRSMLELAAKRAKGIIYVDENCYGPDGPFAERPGWQQIGDAASGTEYVMGRSLGYKAGHAVLPPLPVSDMTTGIVGALAAMMAVRDRTLTGGSYHVVSSLVAADTIALKEEIGLYPPEVVARVQDRFGFVPWTSEQFVSEIMVQVVDGWKRGLPAGYLGEDSHLMAPYQQGPWGQQKLLKPVAVLGDEAATPRWASPAVPNCYHPRDIHWL
ncbi:CoA-transferase family III [Aspergillus karnatakaensis]|uniref:CoA-transferase family III n=1 Tax=Aspergillus karnatakaensis TaxID=1810916 RepID=UPI003CCCEB61